MATKLSDLAVFMPVADGSPANLLHAQRALTALVQGASHVQLLVATNGDHLNMLRHLLLSWVPLLKRRGIEYVFQDFDSDTALAHMAQWAFQKADRPWVMNHDADLLVTTQAWARIAQVLDYFQQDCLFYNFVDVEDREFPGWSAHPTPWSQEAEMRRQYGDHGLVYREWQVHPAQHLLVPVFDVWAGSYVLRRTSVLDNDQLQADLASFKRGQRGYDRVITRPFCKLGRGYAQCVLGATAYHFGVDELMGRNFETYHPLVQADVARFIPDSNHADQHR